MSDRYINTERVGVNVVESIILNDFKWIFREQIIVDMGIDAQIEYVNDNGPTGKLVGIQIKTGLSHFYETEESFTFYLDTTHYKYWINHSLPVILIGHIPEKDITIWQYIDKTTVDVTKKGWKVNIPKTHILTNSSSKYMIEEIITTKSLYGKIDKLFFDKELIRFISKGGKVNLYTEEWLHKSLGRGPFKIILIEDGEEKIVREWSSFYTYTLEDLIAKIFPWADYENDDEFYEENFDESVYFIFPKRNIHLNKIYPYDIADGEVGFYRINLALNKIGKAFLDLEDYLDN